MKIAQSFLSEFSFCLHRLQSSLPILLSGIRRPLSMCIFRSLTKFGWVLGHLFRAQSSLWPQMLMPAHVLLLKFLACLIFFLCRFHSSLPNPNFFCKAFIDSGKLPLFQWILFFLWLCCKTFRCHSSTGKTKIFDSKMKFFSCYSCPTYLIQTKNGVFNGCTFD